jgi:hypothetical protein
MIGVPDIVRRFKMPTDKRSARIVLLILLGLMAAGVLVVAINHDGWSSAPYGGEWLRCLKECEADYTVCWHRCEIMDDTCWEYCAQKYIMCLGCCPGAPHFADADSAH